MVLSTGLNIHEVDSVNCR